MPERKEKSAADSDKGERAEGAGGGGVEERAVGRGGKDRDTEPREEIGFKELVE